MTDRWHLHIRPSDGARQVLDRVAVDVGLVHASGMPRDAEILRVLLVSSFLSDQGVQTRVARALACNLTLVLSAELAAVVARLGQDIEGLASEIGSASPGEPRVSVPPPVIQAPKSRTRAGEQPDRRQVYLTVDRWLRDRLDRFSEGGSTTSVARRIVESALLEFLEFHEPVLRGYNEVIDHAKARIVTSGKQAIRAIRHTLMHPEIT